MKLKSRTLLSAVLCGIICLNICACSESKNTGGSAVNSESSAQSASDNKTEESSQDSESPDGSNGESSEESKTEESSEESSSGGAANADDDQYTDPYSPAPLGEWIKSMVYNPESEKQEVIYWRIVNVNPDAQASVDAYNDGNNFWILEQPDEDFIKFYEVDYEIKYPEDYTASDFGITASSLSLSAEKPNGRGFEKDGTLYLGVGSATDVTKDTLGKAEEYPQPGDTVKFRSVYTMIEGETDYVFCLEYKDLNDERVSSYAASH